MSKWKTAELVSLATSIGGTIVTALTQQALYAAIPITLSLCLNRIDRWQSERLILPTTESVKKLEAITQETSQLLRNHLEERNNHQYQLIPDSCGNRSVLIQAIAMSQNRLIIVSPWLRKGAFDSISVEVEEAINRGVEIRIGFGYYQDLDKAIALDSLKNWSYFPDRDSDRSYDAIPLWLNLQRKYGKQSIYLKWLGTHEKFLVSDRKIALISSYNFLSGSASGKSRELGIKTDDPEIIAALLLRSELDFN